MDGWMERCKYGERRWLDSLGDGFDMTPALKYLPIKEDG